MQDHKKNRLHPYVPHLLADIKAACQADKQAHRNGQWYVEEQAPASIEERLQEVERWIAGEELPEHTFGYYCGLQRQDFPPAEQLNHEDLALICNAFEELLCSWNSGIGLPEKFPLHLRYTFMVSTLDEGFTPVQNGHMSFDYCTGYVPGCPFKEYCPCLELPNSTEDESGNTAVEP